MVKQNNRPKKHFELLRVIEENIKKDRELMCMDYEWRYDKIMRIYYYLAKELDTKLAIHGLRKDFNGVLGEILNNDDIGSPLNDNSFDAIITSRGRNKIVKIKFGDEVIKAQFKKLEPKALDRTVSLSSEHVDKYIKSKCDVIFILQNSSCPDYYNKKVRDLLYFKNGKITAEGYQYYLLPYRSLIKGKKGDYGNFYYEIKHNSIMSNIGLRYKNGQLNLDDDFGEENKTLG
jgi:hypothetical protein